MPANKRLKADFCYQKNGKVKKLQYYKTFCMLLECLNNKIALTVNNTSKHFSRVGLLLNLTFRWTNLKTFFTNYLNLFVNCKL